MTIAGLIGIKSAYVTERLGKRRAGAVLIGTGVFCCVILMFTSNPWISVLGIIVLRVAFSLLMPLIKVIENQQVTHKNRATALSIHSVIMDGTAVATNLLFGKATDMNLTVALGMGGFFCVIGLGLYQYATKRMRIS